MASAGVSIEPAKVSLSSNDSAVLQALFDAESSPSSAPQHDSSLPKLPHISDSELPALQELELKAIRPLNTSDENIPSETIQTAISELSEIIEKNPNYASAYLNRAQALRLLIDTQIKTPTTTTTSPPASLPQPSHATQLFKDIAQTISLLTPATSTSPVSPLQSRTLANAHTHRAYILYKAGRPGDGDSENEKNHHIANLVPPQLRELGNERLEEMASYDFQLGGRYGNEVAKQMAVMTNPYAKMCGAIVKDAMKAEIAEWAG